MGRLSTYHTTHIISTNPPTHVCIPYTIYPLGPISDVPHSRNTSLTVPLSVNARPHPQLPPPRICSFRTLPHTATMSLDNAASKKNLHYPMCIPPLQTAPTLLSNTLTSRGSAASMVYIGCGPSVPSGSGRGCFSRAVCHAPPAAADRKPTGGTNSCPSLTRSHQSPSNPRRLGGGDSST